MMKKVPRLKTDKQADAFVASRPVRPRFLAVQTGKVEFEMKDDQINMRVPKPLLAAVLIQDYVGHRKIEHTVKYTSTNPARFEKLWR